jgi:hypothetical protein
MIKNRIDPLFLIIIIVIIIGLGVTLFPNSITNLTPALIAVNLILVLISYAQWRNSTRPLLTITLRGDDFNIFNPHEKTIPDTIEISGGDPNLLISNISNQIASELTINFLMQYQVVHVSCTQHLSYLNSGETTRIIVPLNKISEKYPDQFTIIKKDNDTVTLPKTPLNINLFITVSYGAFPRYTLKNSYIVDWQHKDNSSESQVVLWNIRDELPIYKSKME